MSASDDWSPWEAAELSALMSSEYVRGPIAIDRENGVLQVYFSVQAPGYCQSMNVDIGVI